MPDGVEMRILMIGAGGVGSAAVGIAARRGFFEAMVVADYDLDRATRAVAGADRRFSATRVDASSSAAITELCRAGRITHVVNAVDPRFVMPIFEGAFAAGADYLDMAMSLSRPHPDRPHELTGIKLGDEQFALAAEWEARGALALVGMGVEPGLSDVFARYAADHLFSTVDSVDVRDGADLVVAGPDGEPIFAPTFSIWTTIEECLNPPVVWERDRGWFTTAPFAEPEVFDFPEGIGPVECVHVEHEEVVLVPRWVDARRVTFKYGLGAEFVDVLRTLHKLGLDGTDPVEVRGGRVSPRDVVAACLPDPASLGDRMRGRTCAGTRVTGTGPDGHPREVYLYQVADNEETMARDQVQAVVWQTAVNPVAALELVEAGVWSGAGVLGPEAFDAVPFLDLVPDYGAPWRLQEREPAEPTVSTEVVA
jgi:saccharopine dehydrogenase (NAD+, L-lysine forming)